MKKFISIVAIAALITAGAASAQHIDFENSVLLKCTDPAGVESEITVSELDVLAKSDSNILNLINGRICYVNTSDMENILEGTVDFESLPEADDTNMFTAGGKETAKELQEALIHLGYLNGSADGSFGKMSVSALQMFQEKNGLKISESASSIPAESVLTAKALAGMDQSPVIHLQGSEPTPEQKFVDIYGKTDFDLDPFCSGDYSFSFDKFENTGIIHKKGSFDWTAENTTDLDRIAFSITEEISVQKNGDVFTAEPHMVVTGRGARRHYIRNVFLRSGDTVCKCEAIETTGGIEGTDVIERTVYPLTEETIAVLAAAEANGSLIVRFEGKYNSFDAVIE